MLEEVLKPEESESIDKLLKYLESRGIGPDWYDFMYSTNKNWDVIQKITDTILLER